MNPSMELVIPSRFNGPRASGNGGWTASLMADAAVTAGVVDAELPVTVMLTAPPPLAEPLRLTADAGTLTAWHGEDRVLSAAPAPDAALTLVRPVAAMVAEACAPGFCAGSDHPFPTCYVCGPDRTDGLRLRPGPLAGQPGHTACVWDVRDDDPRHQLWAALDCPGGWSADISGRPMVLGTITAQTLAVPSPGDRVVIVGRVDSTTERKALATTCAWREGELLGWATSTWVRVDPEFFNALRA